MADGILITPGTTTTVATDDIGGTHYQIFKQAFGALDTATLVSATSGLPIQGSQTAVSTTNWTSATSGNTANSISTVGMNTITVAMNNTSTMTGGVLTFEVSPDSGTTWFSVAMARIDSYTVETSYTLATVQSRAWSTSVDGFTNFRVRLSTVITGTGTATVFITAQAMAIEPIVIVGQSDPSLLHATPHQAQLWFEINVPGYSTTAYAAGDQLGTLISITNAARVTGGTGWINAVLYHDDDAQIGAIDVVFYNDTVTLPADNAAFSTLSDADARKIVYVANITYVISFTAQRYGQLTGLSVPYFCTATTLYCSIITRTTPTLTGTTTQRIRFGLTRD